MLLSIWSPDLTMLSAIMLSCAVFGVGFFMFKRIDSFKHYANRILRTTASFQPSTSNSILPSFATIRPSPSYVSLEPGATSPNLFFGIQGVFEATCRSENKLITVKPFVSAPGLPSSPASIAGPPTASYFGDASSTGYSPSGFSSTRVVTIVPADDRLPPNITMPIPRQTALDRVMETWWKEKKGAVKTATKHRELVECSAYEPVARASNESSRTPNIIVTQPSTKSFSAHQSSYAFMLSTGPDEDPFFWDTIPLPLPLLSAGRVPAPALYRSKDAKKENRIPTAVAAEPSTKETPSVWTHLSVPSRSGKCKSKMRRAVLGDATNSRRSAKSKATTS